MSTKTFNGHKDWNHWNVSLWINNDEGLYGIARSCVANKLNKTRKEAAECFMRSLAFGNLHTPDGAPYSMSSVMAAMAGMEA